MDIQCFLIYFSPLPIKFSSVLTNFSHVPMKFNLVSMNFNRVLAKNSYFDKLYFY